MRAARWTAEDFTVADFGGPLAGRAALQLVSPVQQKCPPDTPPSMTFWPLNAAVIAGQPVTVTGSADPGSHYVWSPVDNSCASFAVLTYTSLTVTLDDGTQVTASNHDSQWADWSAAVTFKEAGQHTATAAATSTSGRTVSGELRVQVQAAGPTITLQSAVTSPTLDYDLVVSAKPTLGVSATVHYSLDNATFYPMTEVLSLWFTKLPGLFSNPIPAAGGPPVTIWLRGADASGTVTLPVQISPVDTTPPAVLSLAPADGARAKSWAVPAAPSSASLPR